MFSICRYCLTFGAALVPLFFILFFLAETIHYYYFTDTVILELYKLLGIAVILSVSFFIYFHFLFDFALFVATFIRDFARKRQKTKIFKIQRFEFSKLQIFLLLLFSPIILGLFLLFNIPFTAYAVYKFLKFKADTFYCLRFSFQTLPLELQERFIQLQPPLSWHRMVKILPKLKKKEDALHLDSFEYRMKYDQKIVSCARSRFYHLLPDFEWNEHSKIFYKIQLLAHENYGLQSVTYQKPTQLALKLQGCYSNDIRFFECLGYKLKIVTSCRKIICENIIELRTAFAFFNCQTVKHLEIQRSILKEEDFTFIKNFRNLDTLRLLDICIEDMNNIDQIVAILLSSFVGIQNIWISWYLDFLVLHSTNSAEISLVEWVLLNGYIRTFELSFICGYGNKKCLTFL